ncbi:hypothetical protein ACQ45D_023530, partial [Escherichia coli]|nr:hypothetical protein [Escherichia coli]
ADRNRSHWSTSKTPSYTKSVSWQHHPVNKDIVDGLMKIYPDPVLNPGAREELNAASSIWLTKAQYQYLLRMENTLQPESRISLLLELVSNAEHHGFMERLVNIP